MARNFDGSTSHINQLYNKILAEDLTQPQSRIDFGEILHTAQDFYAHSNWIELQNAGFISKSKIVDDGLDIWRILNPNDIITGTNVVVIENPILQALSRPMNSHIVLKPLEPGNPGLITGIAFDSGKCPSDIALGHYDPVFVRFTKIVADPGRFPIDKIPNSVKILISPAGGAVLENRDGVTGLNKDNPKRVGLSFGTTSSSGFDDARGQAIRQTTHEWCRLINLEFTKNGQGGVSALFDAWVINIRDAISPCLGEIPNLKDIVVIPIGKTDDALSSEPTSSDTGNGFTETPSEPTSSDTGNGFTETPSEPTSSDTGSGFTETPSEPTSSDTEEITSGQDVGTCTNGGKSSECHPSSEACSASDILLNNDGSVLCDPTVGTDLYFIP